MIRKMILENRLVRLLLNAAVLVGVSLALVDRGQAYFGPTPPSPLDSVTHLPDRAINVSSVTTAHIFGIPEDENRSAILTRTSLNLVVTGLMASDGTNSLALISANGQPEAAFATGQEILPGVKLRSVEHDRVVILRNGALETVPLKELAEGGGIGPLIVAAADMSSTVTPGSSSPWTRRGGLRVAANSTSPEMKQKSAPATSVESTVPQGKTPHAQSPGAGPTSNTTENYKGIDVKGRPPPSGSYGDIANPRPPSGSLDDIAVGKRPMSSAPPITPPNEHNAPPNPGASR